MTKQNMPRLTESQLFTIEALNRIEGFVWPAGAKFAAMDNCVSCVDFYVNKVVLRDRALSFIGKRSHLKPVHLGYVHPDWRNSLITREQFESVDGWVRSWVASVPKSIPACGIEIECGMFGRKWRYRKPSNAEIKETSAITDPAPYFARRSFSWVGCENGFIIPDRIKEAEFNILGEPVIVILAEVDEILQEWDGSIFRAAHIDINLGEAICNHTNQNITAHVIRYLPIDAREANDHEIQPTGNLIQEVE